MKLASKAKDTQDWNKRMIYLLGLTLILCSVHGEATTTLLQTPLPRLSFSSIIECMEFAYNGNGLNMSHEQSREYCLSASIEFTSIITCVQEAYHGAGFNMKIEEAQNYCRQQSFHFSSPQQCIDEAFHGSGFNMPMEEARLYCEES